MGGQQKNKKGGGGFPFVLGAPACAREEGLQKGTRKRAGSGLQPRASPSLPPLPPAQRQGHVTPRGGASPRNSARLIHPRPGEWKSTSAREGRGRAEGRKSTGAKKNKAGPTAAPRVPRPQRSPGPSLALCNLKSFFYFFLPFQAE